MAEHLQGTKIKHIILASNCDLAQVVFFNLPKLIFWSGQRGDSVHTCINKQERDSVLVAM